MVAKLLLLRRGACAVALSGMPMLAFTVHAAEGKSNRVKANELPIYTNPDDEPKYDFVEEKPTAFTQWISGVRQAVWGYCDSMKETTDKIKEKYEVGKAHSKGMIDYIQNDPGMLPRAGLITVAGLGGVVAGYRGGVLRKLTFSSLAMLAATSLCYPNQAVDISTQGYDVIASQAQGLWESASGKKSSPDLKPVKEVSKVEESGS